MLRGGTYFAPKVRSPFRTACATVWFRLRRYGAWHLYGTAYARTRDRQTENHPSLIFRHQTPLYRRLRQVDMRLQQNKVVNLELALPRLNHLVLRPGETLSFWRLVGRPTRRKGYLEGMVLVAGRVVAGTGGGLCQLSNLLYWLTLHTPLTVVERWRHSYDVFPDADRTQPFGSGATVAYNYVDLQIKNDTGQAFQLRLRLTATHLEGEWWSDQPAGSSYRVYEKEHWITQEPWGGYVRHNSLYRQVRGARGELLADELVTHNHAIMMYPPMLKG